MKIFPQLLIVLILFVILILLPSTSLAEPEEYPNDFNSSRLIFNAGLYVSPRDGRYMVTGVDTSSIFEVETGDRGSPFNPEVGDQLVRANGHLISSLTLSEILANNEGIFVLPLISVCSFSLSLSVYIYIYIFNTCHNHFIISNLTINIHIYYIVIQFTRSSYISFY